MKIYQGSDRVDEYKIFIGEQLAHKAYLGNRLVYSGSGGSYFPRETVHLGVIGDSTIAAGYGGNLVPSYIAQFNPITSVATPGDTILGQRSKFSQLSNHKQFDVVILQIGLNDMNVNQTTQTVLNNYQSLVNYVRSVVDTRCKIYVSKMSPARQRFIDYFGETNGLLSYQRWLDLNYAIEHTIINVDGRITSHESLLNDGDDNLKAEFDTGDHIHENVAGRQIIANAWRDKLIADQILSV